MPVAGQTLMDHLSGGDIQRREQRRGPVALVVVRHGARPPLLERKSRLGPVQRLDLALLVEGEDDRPLRRRHVEPHHVAELLDEAGIGGELEVAHPVGLQPVRLPDPPHLAVMDSHALCHQPRAPVCSARGLLLECAAHDLGLELGRDAASRAAGPGPVLESRETLVVIPVQPALHGRQRDADLAGQGPARQTAGRTQDDPGALHAPLRGRAGSKPIPRAPCGPRVAIESFVTWPCMKDNARFTP